MDFFELIGGFILSPRQQTRLMLDQGISKREMRHVQIFLAVTWIFIGILLTFLYLYPEMLYFASSRALLGKTRLYVSTLGLPYINAAVVLLVYLMTVKFNRGLYGRINYWIGKRVGTLPTGLTIKQYRYIFAYTVIPFYLWAIYGLFRLLFTEKLQVVQLYFPFISWSLENIAFWGLFGICFILKWIIGFQIQKETFQLPSKYALIAPVIEGMIFVSLIIAIDLISTPILSWFINGS